MGTLVRSLASLLNTSFGLLGFDVGTSNIYRHLGTLVTGGDLGTLVRSLASPLNKSFKLLRFDLGTRDMWRDLGALVRGGLGDIGLGLLQLLGSWFM